MGGRWWVEQAVGERAADAFVEENKQECCLVAFGCEAVGITLAVAFDEPVSFHLPEVVAQLGEDLVFLLEAVDTWTAAHVLTSRQDVDTDNFAVLNAIVGTTRRAKIVRVIVREPGTKPSETDRKERVLIADSLGPCSLLLFAV